MKTGKEVKRYVVDLVTDFMDGLAREQPLFTRLPRPPTPTLDSSTTFTAPDFGGGSPSERRGAIEQQLGRHRLG